MKVKFKRPFKHPDLYRLSNKAGKTEVVEIDDKYAGILPRDTVVVEAPVKKAAPPSSKTKAPHHKDG